jgi:hypothetical protein
MIGRASYGWQVVQRKLEWLTVEEDTRFATPATAWSIAATSAVQSGATNTIKGSARIRIFDKESASNVRVWIRSLHNSPL